MNQAEIKRRMLINWEKEGKPICRDCHRPVYGVSNMRAWKTNGNLCPFCFIDSITIRENPNAGIPPLGIRHEG